ncbi:hypothetical protein [Nostoc sp. UHCC 0302]
MLTFRFSTLIALVNRKQDAVPDTWKSQDFLVSFDMVMEERYFL